MKVINNLLSAILTHYEKKEYVSAEKIADELIAVQPEFHRGQFLKAVILEETGRAEEAEKYYMKAGNKYTLWFRLAAQLQDADPDRAVMYYERVGEMDPQNNMIWYNLGNLHEKQGNVEKARASFQRLDPIKDVLSKIVTPLGFMILMFIGATLMIKRGEYGVAAVVTASAILCIFWLKRDGGTALRMVKKKKQYQ